MQDKPIKTDTHITVVMPVDEARLFRELCRKTGISITKAARRAIRAYIPAMQRMATEIPDIAGGINSWVEQTKDGME